MSYSRIFPIANWTPSPIPPGEGHVALSQLAYTLRPKEMLMPTPAYGAGALCALVLNQIQPMQGWKRGLKGLCGRCWQAQLSFRLPQVLKPQEDMGRKRLIADCLELQPIPLLL